MVTIEIFIVIIEDSMKCLQRIFIDIGVFRVMDKECMEVSHAMVNNFNIICKF